MNQILRQSNRFLNLSNILGKGHSHYQNTINVKNENDSKKAALSSKLSREAAVAVRERKGQIEGNPLLETILQRARALNVPKNSVMESAKKASLLFKSGEFDDALFLACGLGGYSLLILVNSVSPKRVKYELRSLFKRHGAKELEISTLRAHFVRKGLIRLKNHFADHSNFDPPQYQDKIDEYGIIVGAQHVIFTLDPNEGQMIDFITDPNDFDQVNVEIKNNTDSWKLNEIFSGSITYIPSKLVELPETDLQKFEKLVESIDNHEEVDSIFDNVLNFPSETYKFIKNISN